MRRTSVVGSQSWFAVPMTPRLCPAADISGPAGLDNHRTPVMASHRPGGEPGHALIDTRWEITMTTDTEALVRRAYHLAEGDVLDVQGFIDLFAEGRCVQRHRRCVWPG